MFREAAKSSVSSLPCPSRRSGSEDRFEMDEALASQRVTGINRKDRSDKRKLTKILLKVELKKNTCETTSFVKEKREV